MFDVIIFGNRFVSQHAGVAEAVRAAVEGASATPFMTEADVIAAATRTLRQLGWRVAAGPTINHRADHGRCHARDHV